MASNMLSSDSEYSTSDIGFDGGPTRKKVDRLAATLQGTNKNLRAMDRMLDDYRGIGDKQERKMDKLRDDLTRTTDRIHEEKMRSRPPSRSRAKSPGTLRMSDLDAEYARGGARRRSPTSPLRDYETASDRGYHSKPAHQTPHGASVRFYDDMDTHQVHRGIRDLTSHQVRLADDMNTELDRRNKWEADSRRTFHELHDAMRKPDQTMSSVDKRLQAIQDELRSERIQLKQKHEEVGAISSELKKALDKQKEPSIEQPPSDSQRNLIQTELEKVRQRLGQSESSRQVLMAQIDEIKKQLTRSDEEKSRMKSHLDQQAEAMREERRKLSYNEHEHEYKEQERQRLEKEVRELRGQLSKSASVVRDFSDTQRELDKSERQRTQLSDHIEVLNKDLETREKQMAKVITQYQAITEKYEETEQLRKHLGSQLDDASTKLRETTKISESCSSELRDTQKNLQETESKKKKVPTATLR